MRPPEPLKLEDIFRIDFRGQSATCVRCDDRSVVTRVAQDVEGRVLCASFCSKHAREEQEIAKAGGMEQTGSQASFINRKLMDRFSGMTEQIQAALYEEGENDDD
jgi:hypothetical protein